MSVNLTDLSPAALAAYEEKTFAEFSDFIKAYEEKLARYTAEASLNLVWDDKPDHRPAAHDGYRCSVRCDFTRNGEPILKDPFGPSPQPLRTEWMIVYVYRANTPNACGYSLEDEDISSDLDEMMNELALLNGEGHKPGEPEVIGGTLTKGEFLGWSMKNPSDWNKREKRYALQLCAAGIAPVLGLLLFFFNRKYGKYALILCLAYFVWIVIVRNIHIARRVNRMDKEKKERGES